MLHENGWVNVCVWICSFSADFWPKARKHILHLNFLMLKCTVIKCLFKLNCDENVFPQSLVHMILLSLPMLIRWLRIAFISSRICSFNDVSSSSLTMHSCEIMPGFRWLVCIMFSWNRSLKPQGYRGLSPGLLLFVYNVFYSWSRRAIGRWRNYELSLVVDGFCGWRIGNCCG